MVNVETQRLILRNWQLDDAKDLFEYAQNPLVGPDAGWKPHQSVEESRTIIEMFIRQDDVYAIELKSTGKVIGSIGIHDRSPDDSMVNKMQREIGYVLNPEFWGNGYIPEAVERVKQLCFEQLNIEILWCGHFDYNLKSKRVNEKCGFRYRFTKEQVLNLLDGKIVNTLYYSVVNPRLKNRDSDDLLS